MIPMFDPMLPEATLLFAISPALAGVAAALIGGVAMAIAGTLSELRRPPSAPPSRVATTTATPQASRPLAA